MTNARNFEEESMKRVERTLSFSFRRVFLFIMNSHVDDPVLMYGDVITYFLWYLILNTTSIIYSNSRLG